MKIFTRSIIKIKKRRLGTGHPDYAVMLRNLASLYMEKGVQEKVEPLLLQAVQIYRTKFNEQSPVYAKALSDLGNYYLSGGNIEKSKPLLNKALSIQKVSLRSEEHTSELQSHSFISYAVFCLKKKK